MHGMHLKIFKIKETYCQEQQDKHKSALLKKCFCLISYNKKVVRQFSNIISVPPQQLSV